MSDTVAKKPWYKRWWAITLFIIIGLAFLGSIFGESPPAEDSAPSAVAAPPAIAPSAAAPQTLTAPPAPKTYKMGDSINAGDFTWTVTDVTTASTVGSDYMEKQADGIFIILDVQVANTATTAQYLTGDYVKLIDDQGREFSPDTAAAFYLKPAGSALLFDKINPGIVKHGKIVYDVPKGLTVTQLRITALFGSEEYNVALTT